jgi:hypothetical protein
VNEILDITVISGLKKDPTTFRNLIILPSSGGTGNRITESGGPTNVDFFFFSCFLFHLKTQSESAFGMQNVRRLETVDGVQNFVTTVKEPLEVAHLVV